MHLRYKVHNVYLIKYLTGKQGRMFAVIQFCTLASQVEKESVTKGRED